MGQGEALPGNTGEWEFGDDARRSRTAKGDVDDERVYIAAARSGRSDRGDLLGDRRE